MPLPSPAARPGVPQARPAWAAPADGPRGLAPAGTGASVRRREWAGVSSRGAALVSAGVRQPQVEEDVLAHQVAPAGGAERAGQALGRAA